ncbi:MAG: methylenetetrahydrofolate reductase [NAD(P)H] [Alphaproteobacteria bacterium]|nr:methylenetetrahydrofolate reductase [NAD(P)H] [Alphaproteobacteria bacterium]
MSHTVSFEFFPPKTEEMEQKLWQAVSELTPFLPNFVSVTYGAGGSTRERTHAIVGKMARETMLKPAAHLTCVNASRDEVDAVADGYWQAGVRHIVALRGDPPQGMESYVPHPNGYRFASELVAGLKKKHDFEITVAAFPEKHPQSASFEQDIDVLKAKIDAGATRAITQYFFDTSHYARFLERVRRSGIAIPILPGVIPIGNFATIKKFSAMCGTHVPAWLQERFAPLEDKPEERAKAAVDVAVAQCQELLALGCDHLHFYTLNRADLTRAILARI